MKKIKICALLALMTCSSPIWSAPLTPEQALQRFSEFSITENSMKMKAPAKDNTTLVYTQEATGFSSPALYVFNTGDNGFTILSADDRLPAVLGFSNSGIFEYNKISPEFKWWLGEYAKDISRLYEAEGVDTPMVKSVSPLKKATVTDHAPIEPMLSTKWDQMEPYNQLVPRGYPTGCVATAMAQIMKYHEWPVSPTGGNGGESFEGTVYDWDNMLDIYERGRYSTEQAEAVAVLMRQCGLSVNMMYSPYASGAYSFNVPIALSTYFGYDEGMRLEFRDYHKMSEWNNIVYAELEANRPVYYSGASSSGGHAFVCDGYLGNNYFHFNWGWSGYQDGYFLLNALNPGVGGTGSYAGGYNSQQTIITGVKKSEGKPATQQLTLLSTGSFMYDSKTSKFGVDSDPEGYNMFYNPLGYIVSGSLGLKVTPLEGGGSRYVQGNGSSFSLEPGFGIKDFSCSVSGFADGVYKCEPVFYASGNWYDVPVVVGTQPYVTMTVSGGKSSFSNEGIPVDQLPRLLSGVPRTMPEIYADGAKIFRVTVFNVSGGDYNSDLTLSLYEQGKGGAGVVREVTKYVSVPGNSALDIEFIIERANPAGAYEVYLTDNKGNQLISDYNNGLIGDYVVNTRNSGRDIESTARMTFSDISPNTWTLGGGGIGLMMNAQNVYFSQVTQSFIVKLFDSGFSEIHKFGPYEITLDADRSTIVNFTSRDIDLKAGYYYWQVQDESGKNLSRLYPLMVTSETKEKNGIYYQITDESVKFARIVAPTLGEYDGNVVIPDQIDGYLINDYTGDAFSFASDLKSLTLPWAIKRIENGSFYNATSLERFSMNRTTPPVLYPEAFGVGVPENIYFNTYAGCANLYANSPLWNDFIYSSWDVNLDEGVSLNTKGLEINPLTGAIYSPYYIGCDEACQFEMLSDDPEMGFRALITVDGVESSVEFWRKIWLPVLNGKSGKVKFIAVPGLGVEDVDVEAKTVTVVRLDGVTVLRNADAEELQFLPAGIYLINGQKTVIAK